jgi:hypothetical protein
MNRVASHRLAASICERGSRPSGDCDFVEDRPMKHLTFALALVVVLAGAAAARASDPTGIYARIDKVVLEPNADAPERIQVWGQFMLAKGRSGDDYAQPAAGYVYYTLAPDKADQCRKAWADLKKVAGTDQCVSFGSRYRPLGTVRKAGQKPENPDPYPVAGGVVKVPATNPQAQALKGRATS